MVLSQIKLNLEWPNGDICRFDVPRDFASMFFSSTQTNKGAFENWVLELRDEKKHLKHRLKLNDSRNISLIRKKKE